MSLTITFATFYNIRKKTIGSRLHKALFINLLFSFYLQKVKNKLFAKDLYDLLFFALLSFKVNGVFGRHF